jgi:leucyl aminopeptidase
MPLTIQSKKADQARPIHCVARDKLAESGANDAALAWARANRFTGEAGKVLVIPGPDGDAAGAFLGLDMNAPGLGALAAGALAKALPEGDWYFEGALERPTLAALGAALGGYAFTRYGKKAGPDVRIACPDGADAAEVTRIAEGVFLARDMINTPANDMGPEAIEQAARELAGRHKANISVIAGDALLQQNFPMIHAVGRAAAEAPRLIDMRWGPKDSPKVTLVGKGVAFDTGGLDIKPASNMLLMKKDMGGAANVLGLAHMIMAGGLKVRAARADPRGRERDLRQRLPARRRA